MDVIYLVKMSLRIIEREMQFSNIARKHKMIKTKKDYETYLEFDKKPLGITKSKPSFLGDEIWKYEIELRTGEYLQNCKPLFWKVRFLWHRFKFHYLGILCCGYCVPYNVCEEGLALVHLGPIIINSGAKIGHNCRIHSGVTIGATNGSDKAATIGNNVFISSGATIIGEVRIGDNAAIGANALVIKDVAKSVTVGGVPAKVISQHDSSSNMVKLKNY